MPGKAVQALHRELYLGHSGPCSWNVQLLQWYRWQAMGGPGEVRVELAETVSLS